MSGPSINLVAIQAAVSASDYVSAAAFRSKILGLSEEAVAGCGGAPTLLAFPELIGFPLLLALDNEESVKAARVSQGALSLVKRHWREVLGAAWRYRTAGLNTLYLWRALPAYRAYRAAFAEAARTFGVSIVAGTTFLPWLEQEVMRGLHITDTRVYNTAFTFSPLGGLLGRTRKRYFTSGAESSSGLSSGPLSDLRPLRTPVGKVGVTVCLDAFYSSVIERLDGLGAQIIVQPSANDASWQRPWPGDPSFTEGEAWLEHGLRAQVQNRLNVQLGVNPMLVGNLWELTFRGRSSIVANTRFFSEAEVENRPGLVAIADTADQAAWVRATLTLHDAPQPDLTQTPG